MIRYISFLCLCLIASAGFCADTKITHADAAKAATLVEQKKVVVLDVRTPGEFAEGHIEGAKNIDFRSLDFEKLLSALDKKQTYLVHCAAGGRSTSALKTFSKLGFEQVVHLDGGMNGWLAAGKPAVK